MSDNTISNTTCHKCQHCGRITNYAGDAWHQKRVEEIEQQKARIADLEQSRNREQEEANYYRTELARAHELLGRVMHQLSERWDSVRLTKYYPTDNLTGKRNIQNPTGRTKDSTL